MTLKPEAFYGCTSLTSINLPTTVKVINYNAFFNCLSLTIEDLSLPNLETLGSKSFNGTDVRSINNLGKITALPEGDANNAIGVFSRNINLSHVILPETLSSVGSYCFYGCTALNAINFPVALNNVSRSAFYNCTSLAIEDLSLPNLETLGKDAFYEVSIKKISNLGKITALPTATSSTQNFGKKDVLEEVVLPDTLTVIPEHSFYNYTSIQKIGNGVFDNITTINSNAFSYLPNWKQAVFFPVLTSVASSSASQMDRNFNSCGFTEFHAPLLDLSNTVIYDGSQGMFKDCNNLRVLEVGNTTLIPLGFARNCELLETVSDLSKVVKIDYMAFYNTPKLERELILPICESILATTASSKDATFYNSGILSLDAPKLLDIGKDIYFKDSKGAFNSCPNLHTVKLGSVTTIGIKSFSVCPNLSVVIINNETPPSLGTYAFASANESLAFYVPDASVTAYQEATNWSTYTDRIKGVSSLQTDDPELYEEIMDYI